MIINQKLLKYLNEIIMFLNNSEDSIYADETAKEIINDINICIQKNDKDRLKILFMPTAPLQDTAIDNGWGDEYCDIAKQIDKLL